MTLRLWLPALALGLAAAAPLSAEQAPAGFDAFDTDGDGVISAEEWSAALERMPAPMAEALRRMPADGTTRAEAAAQRMLERFDTDGDGTLDAEELAAAMTAMANQRGMRGDGPRRPRAEWRGGRAGPAHGPRWSSFERIDADGDGVITPHEWVAARERASERKGWRDGGRMENRRSGDQPRDGSGAAQQDGNGAAED